MIRFAAQLAAIALAGIANTAEAQAGKQILGIPFGEPLRMQKCPSNTEAAKAPCWIDKPFIYKPTGGKLGSVHIPKPESRPEWAAHAWFELSLDRQDKVQQIKVEIFGPADRQQIASSISQRFGRPTENQLDRSDVSWVSWSTAEGRVEMRCQEKCWIEFRTPSEQLAREAEKRERERVNENRPKAP
ncbi:MULTISPECIES: hypothetical protein [Derxia]|uniref:Uncharacterized protein n=1 Tax=Derxia gummosa DSM 723 TaxID=1121388 RepID=A0A8B6XAM2_9BURK|nr:MULTISPECIES: hypothetical protein [Derxia]